MVTNVTSLTGKGLRDWLIQRISALYLLIYALFLIVFLLLHPQLRYEQWQNVFHCLWFQLATLIALITLSLHIWIGVWTVTTDYLRCTVIRLSVQMLVALWLFLQFFWGFMMVWGR